MEICTCAAECGKGTCMVHATWENDELDCGARLRYFSIMFYFVNFCITWAEYICLRLACLCNLVCL